MFVAVVKIYMMYLMPALRATMWNIDFSGTVFSWLLGAINTQKTLYSRSQLAVIWTQFFSKMTMPSSFTKLCAVRLIQRPGKGNDLMAG